MHVKLKQMGIGEHDAAGPAGTEAAPLGDQPAPSAGGRPVHATRPFARSSRVAAIAGAIAALAAVGLGTVALLRTPESARDAEPSLLPITVASPPTVELALPARDIWALLDRDPDFGTLHDPQRLASCLSGLGYPASARVLGARSIEVGGHTGVLLVLPGEQADTVVALAVSPTCSSVDTGLLADTVVHRP